MAFTHKNLDLLNGDSESPEWIVANVVIDMAGYSIAYWATKAVIDDEAMTYAVSYHNNADDSDSPINMTILTYQAIWRTMNSMARQATTKYDICKDYLDAVRTAVFDKDGGDIDSDVADCIIQAAIFGKVIYG